MTNIVQNLTDGVFGIRTWDDRMVGPDENSELIHWVILKQSFEDHFVVDKTIWNIFKMLNNNRILILN